MTKPKKGKIEGRRERWTWPHYPETIYWIQQQRNEASKTDKAFLRFRFCRGLNATIVILSATIIEGFINECLESFANRFEEIDTMDHRLNHEFLNQLNRAN